MGSNPGAGNNFQFLLKFTGILSSEGPNESVRLVRNVSVVPELSKMHHSIEKKITCIRYV